MFIVYFIVAAAGALAAAKPEGWWGATEGWKYADPSANEPSEAGYTLSAIGGMVLAVVFACLGCYDLLTRL